MADGKINEVGLKGVDFNEKAALVVRLCTHRAIRGRKRDMTKAWLKERRERNITEGRANDGGGGAGGRGILKLRI